MAERVTEVFVSDWHPDDKDYPIVYTTEGKTKYALYENHSELKAYIKLNEPCDFVWDWSRTKKKAIVNVYEEGNALLPPPGENEPDKPAMPPPKSDEFGAGQREGMCWKEVGELIRSGKIINVFGKENAMSITKDYRGYLSATLKLTVDGAKLPQWEKEIDKE